jgi:ceramide glucosyltransferase
MEAAGLIHLMSAICVGGASLGCVYVLLAAALALYFPRSRTRLTSPSVPVTILKPLHGSEPGLAERLASFGHQRYDGPVQVICGVQTSHDPAVDVVRELGGLADLTSDVRQGGHNRKISNLANMLPAVRHDVLIIADSDIEVGPHYLANIVSELHRPGVGGVTCVYHGVSAAGHWANHAALAINSQFLPNVIMALSFGLIRPCFGSTIAMHRETLRDLGGFGPFADCLADDYAIGEALRAEGYEVAIPRFSVGHVCFQRSLKTLLSDEVRAARTIRSIDPIGYCGAVITHPFPLALVGTLLGNGDAALLAMLALGCRAVLCLCVEHAFELKRQPYALIPVGELISFTAYVLGYFGYCVTWRGANYRVRANGSLIAEE